MLSIDFDKWETIFYNGIETKYQISTRGKVRIVNTEKVLKQRPDRKGYMRVSLKLTSRYKEYRVHRLVAEAFIPNPHNKSQVNHKNGIKNDNTVENLEWCTGKENMQHAIYNDLRVLKLTTKDVKNICKLLEEKRLTIKEIAKIYNVHRETISEIKKGKRWKNISKKYNIKTNPRLKPKQVHEICRLLEKNSMTMKAICEMFGISRAELNCIKKGIHWKEISSQYTFQKRKNNILGENAVNILCNLYSSGDYTKKELASLFNVARETVYNILKRKGII